MADVATWRTPKFKADANKCANELKQLGNSITPEQIVDFAKNPDSELHKCFEWNDTIAAQKYRIHQARTVMCELVVESVEREDTQFRLFYNVGKKEGYKPIKVIMEDKNEYEKLLASAKADLISIERKYKMLKELKDVFTAIDKIVF